MASSLEYLDYVLDLLGQLDGITSKKMMGEFLLYCDGVLFGGVYDDRFLVKKVPSNEHYEMKEALPYEGAKMMYLVDTDNGDLVKRIVEDTIAGIKK